MRDKAVRTEAVTTTITHPQNNPVMKGSQSEMLEEM